MSRKRDKTDGKVADGDAGLAAAAKAEQKLLRLERKAEAALEEARARLAKAESRLQRRQAEVAAAEDALRARQVARAAGPDGGAAAPPANGIPAVTAGGDGAAPEGPASGPASADPSKPRRRTTRRAAASSST
jgi:hypothetical protein